MASSTSIPRFLLPQTQVLFRPRARLLRPTALLLSARHASKSSSPPSKPIVLEKPAKFNPPSHGRRLPKNPPKTYGPALTASQKEIMATKKYPHMMPAKNSFMYKFLTDKWLHTWITLVRRVYIFCESSLTKKYIHGLYHSPKYAQYIYPN
jgi:hypothetical protein